ncbi:RagB/SusD family nutrient uptake outer membrane protein [Tellurirhabdus rosea]|uniref:RagB/SusD family nutrient uptake outer membrane protein n=1 Tax=Tellurirhabdus rosea TaxID=2674997 RepID=UPI002256B7DC|nr:RagB/SusD family nutrient uptake outer membrane protein [Tellurirhabdus rosea]
MNRLKKYTLIALLTGGFTACESVLEPKPVDLLVDALVLNEVADVEPARLGAYSALRSIASPMVIAGDFSADYIQHNGTFTDYQELGTKQLTAANGAVAALWGALYRTIYVTNFVLERLPSITSLPSSTSKQVTAEMRFLRGFSNFIGTYTYGDIPLVTTTDQNANRNVPRTARATVLASVLQDYQAALTDLPERSTNSAFASKNTVRAALARYYLYAKNWTQAEQFASQVINSGVYSLEADYETIIQKDFTRESILEVGYSLTDDPGTSNFGLNNLFVGRREVIPSNPLVPQLISAESGTRSGTISFDPQQLRGSDNGWTVRKYGTGTADNNNIVIFRLAEMYLIRAEARAQQNKLSGATSAAADINVLRNRAGAPIIGTLTQADMLRVIEQERVYELAFEGHRWYDLVRTGRAQTVMTALYPNWNSRFELWPIPQGELQRNPALKNAQNPGY